MRSIIGTWKLVQATARDAAGNPLPPPYGGKALGRVTFAGDGRMMSVVCDGRPELPAGNTREYSSYCGNYPSTALGSLHGSMPPRIRAGSAATKCAGCASTVST